MAEFRRPGLAFRQNSSFILILPFGGATSQGCYIYFAVWLAKDLQNHLYHVVVRILLYSDDASIDLLVQDIICSMRWVRAQPFVVNTVTDMHR